MKKVKFLALVAITFIFLAVSGSANVVYGASVNSVTHKIASSAKENVKSERHFFQKEVAEKSIKNKKPDKNNFITNLISKITGTDETPKLNGLALAGFILSLLGVGGLGLIFSAVALSQINKNPKRWTGKGFAIAGLVLGILDIIIIIAIMA